MDNQIIRKRSNIKFERFFIDFETKYTFDN